MSTLSRTLTIALFLACPWAGGAEVVEHALSVDLEPARGVVRGVDRITMPEDGGGVLEFELHAAFEVAATAGELEALGEQTRAAGVPVRRYRLRAPAGEAVELRFEGAPPPGDPGAPDVLFVLHEQEAYFDPHSAWYPQPIGRAAAFSLTARLPDGWILVSEGAREPATGAGPSRWIAREPVRGIHLLAGPFVEYRQGYEWGEALVYLRGPDESLARRYLDATGQYIALYSALLGPYPFAKFALVENPRQTGYGMPSFTLIGSRVIRLPFIVHTSYPHEILHSWWGNGVWVDYERGNWAEGLTTYLADHLLAERQGEGAAYRRGALQKYADFVAAAQDFPLTRFTTGEGEASQAVGYGKTMMFFHMLRRTVGDEAFIEALRRFYEDRRFHSASFDDARASFEAVTGLELADLFAQWVERTGAPRLHLRGVEVEQTGEGYRLRGTLAQVQGGEPYRLSVPVAVQVRDRALALETVVEMQASRQGFDLLLPERPQRIAIDPRYDLFRRLGAEELPVSLGQLLAAPRRLFVVPADAPLQKAYRALAEALAAPGDRVTTDREVRALPWEGAVWILGWENRLRTTVAGAVRRSDVRLTSREAEVGAERFDAQDTSVVLTAADEQRRIAWVGAPSAEALEHLARKLPRYSRYGYLAFAGPEASNIAKGEWALADSPLNQGLIHRAPPLRLEPRPPLTAVIAAP